jgi:hypothetical protein
MGRARGSQGETIRADVFHDDAEWAGLRVRIGQSLSENDWWAYQVELWHRLPVLTQDGKKRFHTFEKGQEIT